MSRPEKSFDEKFWANIDKNGPGGCWVWAAPTKHKFGYGRLYFNGQCRDAHRVSWTIHNGDPGDLCVLHRCDNPPCVNPAHLFLGTKADNCRDRHAKGRTSVLLTGETNMNAKLTEAAVVDIRRRYAAGGVRYVDLASEYGVTPGLVGHVVRRLIWAHVA